MRTRTALSACLVVVTCLVATGLLTAPAPAVMPYTITDLGTLGGNRSRAIGINNADQVVGWAKDASGAERAFVWQGGVMTDLGTLGGSGSHAHDINDSGQVVGIANTVSGDVHAFVWEGGSMTGLGTLGGDYSEAYSINNSGQIVGISRRTTSGDHYAFLWENGTMQDLGALLGTDKSWARGINDLGHVAGTYGQYAFLWRDGVTTMLPQLPGGRSSADGINNSDQVVGYIGTSTQWRDAAVWTAGTVSDISPTPHDYTNWSWAYDINNHGQIVGRVGTRTGTDNRAVVWDSGVSYDLNDLLLGGSGWELTHAQAINDSGLIVGFGINPDGHERAFLLTPIPEPGTLLLAALAMLALALVKKIRG